jgi:outer membrane protein assembly factor BamB
MWNLAMRTSAFLAAVFAVAMSAAPATAQQRQQSVLTWHGDAGRGGNFVVPALTWQSAASVAPDDAFDARVDGHLYAQPLYWMDPATHRALLLTASQSNVVQAFDAQSGKEVWRKSVGRPVPRAALPCGNINPLGITGTPVIDPATQAIYFDAAVDESGTPRHQIFGLSLKDGSVLQGFPVDVGRALQSAGRRFDPRTQNQRTALTVLDGTVYAGFSGHFGDCGEYHGFVVGVPLHDPGKVSSFETRARGGGIWAPGGLPVVGHDMFFATGNTFGAHVWSDGEAVFRVSADLHRSDNKRDFFAPADWRSLDARDEDLGGSNPLPLTVPGGGGQALILALGKDRNAYLLDRSNLGGIGGQLAVETVSRSAIRTSPAAYPLGNDTMVAFEGPGSRCPGGGRGGDLTVLKITAGSPPTMGTAWCGAVNGAGSPIVTTTDGHSDPIVWMLGAEGDNRLHAFRGDTGAPLFTSAPLTGLRHFQTLIATQDRLYVGADDRVYAFKIK